MSSWHYVAVKHVDENGEVYYGLHEEFKGLGGTKRTYTQEEVTIQMDSPKNLAHWLRLAADDVEKYDPIEDDE